MSDSPIWKINNQHIQELAEKELQLVEDIEKLVKTFDIKVEQQAHALVTTPGAGKWYKTNKKQAFQHIFIQVEEQAIFEWLPQETMLFNGALAYSEIKVELAETAWLRSSA